MSLQHQKISSQGRVIRDHYFLCNYLPYSYGKDELSRSLLNFKSFHPVDLQAWVECSTKALDEVINEKFVIVRALHGAETTPANSSLDVLGKKLQEVFNCNYRPDLIRKSRRTAPLKFLKRQDRVSELRHAYSFTDTSDFSGKSFLIIDDILTTGATLRAIEDAITNATGNDRISYFTLAYCDYTFALNRNLELKGESYAWQKSSGWLAAEPEEEYNAVNKLKVKIETDFSDHFMKKRKMRR